MAPACAATLLLAGCSTAPPSPPTTATPAAVTTRQTCTCPPLQVPACPSTQTELSTAPPITQHFEESYWTELPDWQVDDPTPAWNAFIDSCPVLAKKPEWQDVCASAEKLAPANPEAIRWFFETRFLPYRVRNADESDEGMITGYYEPVIRGARRYSPRTPYAIYGVPDDLLTVDLGEVYPDLKSMRLRGRLVGNRVMPYFSREEIENGNAPLKGRELFWVEDPVELFFLQIQGSGRIRLENGQMARIGYADQNGHPYRSIGRLLVDLGELPLEKATMQGIQAWGRANPDKLPDLLNANPSYVFFRELPAGDGGPIGALGVPLTPGRSIAVDPRAIPLGAPVYLATTWPNSDRPLNRLVLAQDTGGAIKGNVRADLFWGSGKEAGVQAGRMKQRGKLWVLLPRQLKIETGRPMTGMVSKAK
jgi:peptidoglycan lytic transglycosylase A